MEAYITQLIEDIKSSMDHAPCPHIPPQGIDFRDVPTPDEEQRAARVCQLEELTRISKDQLPPMEMLSDPEVSRLLDALKEMLNEYNWCFVLQNEVPERLQYAALRENFNQLVKVKYWNTGFFEVCRPGTEHKKCALGEHCQCAFYAELFKDFEEEKPITEEERRAALEIEIQHLKWKYDDDWMKYYPYHLDPDYDDDKVDPYDDDMADEDDEDDDWWRR